jgi:hypothetical protein
MDFDCTELEGAVALATDPPQFIDDSITALLIMDYGESGETRQELKVWTGWAEGEAYSWLGMDEIDLMEGWGTTFRIGFQFSGQGEPGIAMDHLIIDCYWYEDDGSPQKTDDDDNDDDSGCRAGSSNGNYPLIAAMILIGLIAMVLGRKEKKLEAAGGSR